MRVEYVGRASLAGSDDARLYATLRTNGPAPVRGLEEVTMVAEAAPVLPARVASLSPDVRITAERTRFAPEDETSTIAETAPKAHRSRDLTASRSDEPSIGVGAVRPPRSDHIVSGIKHRRETEMPQIRHDRFGSAHQSTGEHSTQTASRDSGETARAFAVRELMPVHRPNTRSDERRLTEQKKPSGGRSVTTRGMILPPSRPIHIAATAPIAQRRSSGSHAIHTRDD